MLSAVSTDSSTTQATRPAAFFDLDKTIIAKSSTLALAHPLYRSGLINRRVVLKTSLAQLMFVMRGASHDHMERMRAYASQLCKGWSVSQVSAVVDEALHELIQPLIYEEAADLIDQHHAAGRDVVVVSTSGTEIVEPIARLLGADIAIATRMEIKDGLYTGEVEFYAYGRNKASAITDLAHTHGYDLAASYAYSDSATDLPLLESVGFPHAVNPDRLLRRTALERGWPMLTFARPVRLADRLPVVPLPSARMMTALAVVGATTSVLWATLRRRGRFSD